MDTHSQPGEINFRIGKVPVTIQPYFWLVTIILGGSWFRHDLSPWPIFTWVLACLVSIILHELGHVWMSQLFGAQYCRIVLHGMGGMAIGAYGFHKIWQRILVSLAGPGIQLVLAGIIYLVSKNVQFPEDKPLLEIFVFQLFRINLFWAIFNLMPIYPLDGGHVAREILNWLFPAKGESISAVLSLAICGLMIFWIIQENGSIYNAVIFGLFAMINVERLQRAAASKHYDSDSEWRDQP